MACASCARELPAGARFCPFCGLEVVTRGSEERRLVTVLFADLVGYTTLAEHLDPERVRRLVDRAFEPLINEIIGFGGTIDKVVGDGILALFGAPTAHEDDADRAALAALAMQRSLDEFVAAEGIADPVRLRIGINSGEVVVGSVGTDDYTAMGDVVNVASRLQAMAPAGGIFAGDATTALLSSRVRVERVDAVDVRGRQQSEVVWRIVGVGERAATGQRADAVPFVGRHEQRRLLTSVLDLVASGQSAVVAVTGEGGAGKTRLVTQALDAFAAPGGVVFAGQCLPYGESNVWAPLATALFGRGERTVPTSAERLREASARLGRRLFGFDDDDPGLGWVVEGVQYLGGFPSALDELPPSQARETLFRLVVEALRRRSTIGPVVLWIDDLQWADALLIELLHRIARSLVDRPVLVLTAQRIDAEIDWPPLGDNFTTITLTVEPFTVDEADELVGEVLGTRPGAQLAHELYERSGGNALFLTELARLARDGHSGDALPGTMRALIAAQLDRLAPSQRAIIDNAAVLGSDSPVSSLRSFAAELRQPFSDDDLDALVSDGLLEIEDGWYHFRSDVVREVAYQTLSKVVRTERHAGTAKVMAQVKGVPIERVAHHAATAAELLREIGPLDSVSPSITPRAVKLLHRAARRAVGVGAFHSALQHATRALDLGVEPPRRRRSLLLLRARAATERRETGPARTDAAEALAMALEADDRRHEGMARRLLGELSQIEGDLEQARRELDASVAIFRELDDERELAASLTERGFVEVFGGSLATAEAVLAEAEALILVIGDRRAGAWVREHQAWVAFLSGDVEIAEQRLETAASVFEELGDRAGLSWARALRAYLHFYARELDVAEKLAMEVRAEAVELGERWAPAMMDSLLASIRLWGGSFVEAERLSRRALDEFRSLGDRFGTIQALAPRIRSLVALGRSGEAVQGIEETLSLSDAFGDLAFPTMAASGTAAHLGLGDRAVVLGESALARITSMGAQDGEVRTTLALALCQVGRAEDALSTMLGVRFDFPYAHAVRALASALVGDATQAKLDAEIVWSEAGSTYLDRVVSGVAMIATADDDDRDRWASEVVQVAVEAGDAVALALAEEASYRLGGRTSEAPAAAVGLERGWKRVLVDLAAVAALD